jgi:hypothetical protein
MDFRSIGEVGTELMQRISSGDFPLWSDELGGDLGSDARADPGPREGDEIQVFASTGEKTTDPARRVAGPAQLTDCREGGGDATIPKLAPRSIATASHAAEAKGRGPVPAVVIDLVVWKRVHQWTTASTG